MLTGKSCTLKLKIRQQNLTVEENRKFKEHLLGQIELLMALNTLDFTEQSQGEATSFFHGIQTAYNLLVRNFRIGCLEITVECVNLEGLERLWNDYQSGDLNDLAERCLVTDKLKKKLNVETVQLKTSIAEESYMRCKKALLEKSRECHKLTYVLIAWLGSPNTGFYSFIYLLSALYYFLFIYLHHHFISKIKVGTIWATTEL